MPSDIDMHTDTETGKVSKTSINKRKRLCDGGNDPLSELKKDLIELIDMKFSKLEKHIIELKNQNTEFCKTLEFISAKQDDLEKEMATILKEKEDDRKCIIELQNKLEVANRTQNSYCIEIKNVPKTDKETKTDLLKMAASLSDSLKLELNKHEIDDIYRIKIKSETHPIILVRFTTITRKEEVMRTVKKYNRENAIKLTSKQLGLLQPPEPIYVSEHLTQKTRSLFFLARDFAKSNNYLFCWCSRGRIFLRKKEGMPQLYIHSEIQLAAIKTSTAN